EEDDAPELLPQCAPVLALEVERVDVLVLLRRILGVLDRAVGTMAEPLRVRSHPGMIGRALQCEIERDLEPVLAGHADETIEVGERAELGMDGVVAAFRRTDGPWAPRIARRSGRCVVA